MIVNNANPMKLIDELSNNGVRILLCEHDSKEDSHVAENTWITFEDGTDMQLVQQTIDAHDPTPLPPQPTAEERLKMTEETILFLLMGGM